MTSVGQKQAARKFVERWQAAEGNEQREANSFWIELCGEVLGISNPTHVLDFERKVRTRRIDVFCEDRGILIENKSRGVNLDHRYERGKLDGGEGRMVTPYEQAKWYADNLPRSIRPRWVLTCNFDEIRVYDLEREYPERDGEVLRLDELPGLLHRLSFFTDARQSRLEREKDLSKEAGAVVGELYEALAHCYKRLDESPEEQRSLNVLVTRLVFLLYCEDAGLLHEHQAFYRYLETYETQDMRRALIDLFHTLATPDGSGGADDKRDPYLRDKLRVFPYVNGGLFKEEIIVPQIDDDARSVLLEKASAAFDWSQISPVIFGACFESAINPDTRHAGGMHYTTVEAIHQVIDPLFLDDLRAELRSIEDEKTIRNRNKRLVKFQEKLSCIRVLDPACGSGNFLTETYLCLRELENRVLEDLNAEAVLDLDVPGSTIRVTIDQFAGIEVNDFAVEVAKTALWIAEMQMMAKTLEIVDRDIRPFPLRGSGAIVCANAVSADWNDVLPAAECTYVIGNPPFLGYSNLSEEQKADRSSIFGDVSTLDYVACWYAKASAYTEGHHVRCAFVSTNSICQGQQVKPLWDRLFSEGVHIDFAWRTFAWNSEATDMAHVHCVIVGFSREEGVPKRIFAEDGTVRAASNINGYLEDKANVTLARRANPLCDVPPMIAGGKPSDGGNLVLEPDEKDALASQCPEAAKWIRPFSMGAEFINGKDRFCLWLVGVTPAELDAMPPVLERVNRVREMRLASKKAATRKKADTPWLFDEVRPPQGESYIAVPKVSSGRREYVPMGFVTNGMIPGDKLFYISDGGGLYEFGVLESRFHNAWIRAVAGRLKSDYSYSNTIVYNNFVWPDSSEADRRRIEEAAQAVLDARAAHPALTLADLYDPDNMPFDLRAAHDALDAAVESAYGVEFDGDEEKIVSYLFELYARVAKDV